MRYNTPMTTHPAPRLWHGGAAGLRPGDTLHPGTPGNRRHNPNCPICTARNTDTTGHPIDPTPQQHGVYVTTSRAYARFYASLTDHGDLYRVEPIGPLTPSTEDRFETYVTPAARIIAVTDRAVRLTNTQRRALLREWIAADAAADGWHDRLTAMSPPERRRLENDTWQHLITTAVALSRPTTAQGNPHHG